jgi:hypothetical protein
MDVMAGVAEPSNTIGAAVLLGWGLLDCFFGYRIFRVAVALLGALVLGLLATAAAGQAGCSETVCWVALAVGAAVGLVLSFALYLVGVFLAGFSLGFVVVLSLVPFTGIAATQLVGAVAGAVCGLLAMVMQRFLICAATAFGGAFRVALAAACILDGVDWQVCFRSPELTPSLLVSRWWFPVLVLGLGLFGLIVQLRSTGARKTKAD